MSSIKKCGLCSFLSDLLRRVMCVTSRRGSCDSYYRELGDQDTLKIDDKSSSQQSSESVEIHVTFPRVSHVPNTPNARQSAESNYELDAVTRNRLTSRFLTIQKRRKRQLITRSLCKNEGLLDDMLLGQIQCILEQSALWRFNAFTLDNVSGGHCLPALCVHLFHTYGLISHFKLDVAKVWKLFHLIEEGYHSSNPYHNSVHAADVTQAMHCFLQQSKIRDHMEPIELMASLLAAIAHDMDHPGVNQQFLIATSNHLAALYKNTSVLENHHWRSAVSCILESGVMDEMMEYSAQLKHQICSMILATDITRQQEYLSNFKTYMDTNTLDLTKLEHRHLVLQIALKCADISNPCRSWEISKKWSLKVCDEFFRQGDYERRLNLPVTALCDRHNTSIPKIQTGFFKFVVTPLISEWHRFLKNDLSAQMLENLVFNQNKWEMLLAQEIADETRTEISDADLVDDDLETSTNISESSELLLPPRRSSLNLVVQKQSLKDQFRRFSVPLNVRQDSSYRSRQNRSFDERVRPDDSSDTSERSLHSQLSVRGHCDSHPEKVLSSEKLLPELSIASITTPFQATRLSTVFRVGGNWKLVRQQTFPPLELTARAHSLVPRATSNENCFWSRNVKSDSGFRFDFSFREGLFCNVFRRFEDKTENDETSLDVSETNRRGGSRLRDNLNSVQLAGPSADVHTQRRKSMPADAGTTNSVHERRLSEMRDTTPLLRRTHSGKDSRTRRRGSAPVTSELRGNGRRRPSPLPCQFLARHGLRRSSLPVEVMSGVSY